MKRTTVESSNLNSVGYDVKNHLLEIQFNNGSVYQYFQVPQEVYVGLMTAESHGEYFYAVIRNAFQYRQIVRGTVQINDYADDNDEDDNGYGDEEFDPHDEAFGMWIDDEHWVSYDDD